MTITITVMHDQKKTKTQVCEHGYGLDFKGVERTSSLAIESDHSVETIFFYGRGRRTRCGGKGNISVLATRADDHISCGGPHIAEIELQVKTSKMDATIGLSVQQAYELAYMLRSAINMRQQCKQQWLIDLKATGGNHEQKI